MTDQAPSSLSHFHSSQSYLRLTHVYAEYLGGLRWSSTDDAIVTADGRFFAFSEAIAEFVDGFLSQGRVPPFGYLLHWMDLLQNRRALAAPAIERLRGCFEEAGRNWRNAGAFAAQLSAEVPEAREQPDAEQLGKRLRDRAFPIRWFVSQFHEAPDSREQPPIPPVDFEADLIDRLATYGDEDVLTWLRTGRGPIKDAERLVQEPPVPRSLARVLASLLERPRLAGAETYVPQLVGALALPPRRLAPQELPVGGYTDIVNRGQVEQLLPGQFALEELEFLRRFAEKELLYYRREEPPLQNRQELVVLLDQGVRTWGDVRLVLAAAALAYGRQSLLRQTGLLLAATSNGGVAIDPLQADEETLGRLLEASDLSFHPGLALERVLESPSADALRDVVLLTHPRNLREPDVLTAARRLGERDRLFAVTLDAHGAAALHEVRRGAPIPLRQFHVDFVASTPKPRKRPPGVGVSAEAWKGDIESIPYPFRTGTEPHITHFDFAGDWLLTVSGQATLHLWKLDGTTYEVIPRPCRDRAMKIVLGVLGVAGGFAIAGKIGEVLHLAHCDVGTRTVTLYELGPYPHGNVPMDYDRGQDLVVINASYWPQFVVDLSKRSAHAVPEPAASQSPEEALTQWLGEAPAFARRHVPLIYSQVGGPIQPGRHCVFDSRKGSFDLYVDAGGHFSFTPVADGKPCFIGGLVELQLAWKTLAVRAARHDIGDSVTLLQLSDGAILREYPTRRDKHRISRLLLSPDGAYLGLRRTDHRIEVDAVRDLSLPNFCTRVGGFSPEARLFVGAQCLLLNLGTSRRHWHLFDWSRGKLEHVYQSVVVSTRDPLASPGLAELLKTVRGPFLPGGPIRPRCCGEDPQRYLGGVFHRLWFVLDRFSQVAILDEDERLVAMLIAFRGGFAAWLPDGTRFGTQSLSAGLATPDAAVRIGQALREAWLRPH